MKLNDKKKQCLNFLYPYEFIQQSTSTKTINQNSDVYRSIKLSPFNYICLIRLTMIRGFIKSIKIKRKKQSIIVCRNNVLSSAIGV